MENRRSSRSILHHLLELIDWKVMQTELNDYRKVVGLISHFKVNSINNKAIIHLTNNKKINCVQDSDHIRMSGKLQGNLLEKKIGSKKDCINFLKLFA